MARSTGGPPHTLGRSAVEGGDGGGTRPVSGRKGAFHDLVTSSCTSGKKGTGGGCRRSACAPGTNHPALSAREKADAYSAARCSAARESIAVSSGSDSGNATLPDGGSAAESSSPEPSSSPDAVIDNPSSAGAPNEMLGPALSEDPAYSSGNPRRCDVLEEWEARGGVLRGSSHCNPQITLALSRSSPPAGGTRTGQSKGDTPPSSEEVSGTQIAMVMFPQWEHDSSTSAASACLKPKHEGQRSWPSDEVRKRPHPETHEREAIFKRRPSLVELF